MQHREHGTTATPAAGSALITAAAFYTLCLALTAGPLLARLGTHLPCSPDRLGDPLQHLWIMRWYRSCLFEGRSPVLCPEVQYPIGAPLGNFSPLHLQALLFLPLSTLFPNDVLCFNILWLIGLVTTALGTYLLAYHVLADRLCAWLGGLLVMLGTPVMLHAQATHLELVYLGTVAAVPGRLAAVRGRTEPGPIRLAADRQLRLLVAMAAAYYVVFAAIPAALYVAWQALMRLCDVATGGWLRSRAAWLAVFGGVRWPGWPGSSPTRSGHWPTATRCPGHRPT